MEQDKNAQNNSLIDVSELATTVRLEKVKNVLSKRQPSLTVVLENVHDPHNVSAVFRSCDAVGINEVCLVYTNGYQFPDLSAKSSASAKKWVNQRKFTSINECYDYLRDSGMKIYSTGMNSESVQLYNLDLKQPVALVFGNEHSGVSPEAVASADGNFVIPQVGMIQSLNISVACAVSVYEAYRQRQVAGMYEQIQIEENSYHIMIREWILK